MWKVLGRRWKVVCDGGRWKLEGMEGGRGLALKVEGGR